MPIKEEMQQEGEFLFRRRSLLPVYFLPFIAIAIFMDSVVFADKAAYAVWFRSVGFAIACLGLLVRALSVGPAPKGTSGRSTKYAKAVELNTDGMYSLCRHPIYLGNYFCFLGAWVASGDWRYAALFTTIYWLYYERIMIYEEEFLRGEFGDAYLQWSKTTPAFVPRLSQWQKSTRTFSWRMLFRREPAAWFGVVVGFVVVQAVIGIDSTEGLRVELYEIVAMSVTGLLYLIARFLRKSTSRLDMADHDALRENALRGETVRGDAESAS